MATKETEHRSTCLVCFETRPLKIVGNCKHSFCTECLSTVLESLESGSEVFACPSCKVGCPRPWDGVKGLVDFTGEDVTTVMPEIVQKPKEIFKHTFHVGSDDMFIPCVANLGKRFAVAHSTKRGNQSDAIDVYEFPGSLIKTIIDVPPIYDMSATHDNKLAILSDGTVDNSCIVHVFDPDTGFISSTCDIDVAKPIAIGVTLQNQFVILGYNKKRQKQMIVADKEGVVQHRLVLNQILEKPQVENPNRITCGGRFIFVKGDCHVAVFEIKDDGLQAIEDGIMKMDQGLYLKDISATESDDFYVTNTYRLLSEKSNTILDLDRYQDKENTQKWSRNWYLHVYNDIGVTDTDKETRVATKDGHIVVSHGRTVRVYKIQDKTD